MQELTIIGKSIERQDAFEKVTGSAIYCTDVKVANMLYGRALRSPHPYANIASIDTSQAEQLPGIKAVLVGKDFDYLYGANIRDQYVIAKDQVRFAGDVVALVAATSQEIAEEAVGLISVDYEVLTPLLDPEEAFGENPPAVLHPNLLKYEKNPFIPLRLGDGGPNVMHHVKVRKGDVEKGFADADVVVENKFTAKRIQHCQMEPFVSICKPESDGSFTIWSGSQSIYGVRNIVCEAFNLPFSKVRVISHYIGGGYGGKTSARTECLGMLLAMQTRRPVKVTFSRDEVFLGATTRIPMTIYIKDGITRDGRLIAREMRVFLGAGGYADFGPVISRNCVFGTSGTYDIENFKLDSYGLYVNEPLGGPYRGFGCNQTEWAIESHMDIMAEKIGMDPAKFRLKNVLKEGGRSVMGELVHSIGAEECLEDVTKKIGWDNPGSKLPDDGPWRRGRGISLGNKYSKAPSSAACVVKILEDGRIEVRTSADEVGQGARTALAQIAAEQFKVGIEDIKFVMGDTLFTPYDEGAISSRQTFNTGNAVRLACEDAKREVFAKAAKRLEASPEDLETAGKQVYVKGSPARAIAITSLFAPAPLFGVVLEEGGEILGKATWSSYVIWEDPETGQSEHLCSFYTYGANAVDLAVNVETGAVRIEKVSATFDTGRAINPKMVEGQIEGGVGMGIGATLYEEMMQDEGRPLNPNFMDYKIPTIAEMPRIENFVTGIVEALHKDGPYQAKGLGEAVVIPTSPAIANAIYDAIGVRIKDLPITREKILNALREKGGE